MAARIALLMTMTGLFAAAWSGDHPPIMSAETTRPAHEQPYQEEAIRETALYRWRSSRSVPELDQIADAQEAVQDVGAEKAAVQIDWIGLWSQVREQSATSAPSQPLWHRLTSPVARMLTTQQQNLAAEPGAAVRK